MSPILLFDILSAIVSFFVLLTLFKNYVFLLISPFHPFVEELRYYRARLSARKAAGVLAPLVPKVSVIIPAWNEEVGILRTVKSVLNNGYDNFQVIVVNDGSTDASDALMKGFLARMSHKYPERAKKLVYIYQENGGKGKALNTGIKQADGEIILTMDADSELEKNALAKLVRYYADPLIMAVVGHVRVGNTKTLVGLAQHLEYYFGFYNKRGHAIMGAEYIFGGACASFRRSVFEEIGLFDEKNKTEDIEMSMRLRYHGFRCTYAEDVICHTEGASDFRGLIEQRVRWKKGRFDTFIKYRTMFLSTEEPHNFFLSFFVLPFSLLAEIQLIFEPIAITILVTYSIITQEFLSLAVGILFIFLVYLATALFSGNRPRPLLIALFPFTWPLFYVLDWVEFMALWKSLKMLRRGQEVVWQKWDRRGVSHYIK